MKQRLRKAAAVAALLAGTLAGALLLLDSDAVRQRIEQQVSALSGGRLRYESLALRLLPWPHVELRGVSIKIPGSVEGAVTAAEIRPALLPLLAGRFRPSLLRIDRPVLQVSVAPAGSGDPLSIYRQAVGPAVSALVREASGMRISIREGTIDLLYAGGRTLKLTALEASVNVSAEGVVADLGSAADLWQKAQVHARIEAGSLAASASLQLTGLRPGDWMSVNAAGGALRLRPAPVDGKVEVETDGAGTIRLRAAMAAPQLALERGARRHELGAWRAAWEIVRDGRGIDATLKDFDLGGLARGASGAIRIPLDRPIPAFEFRLAQLDLAQLHAAAAALTGSSAPAPFSFVPAGILRELSLSGSWPEGSASLDPGALRADARIEAATVAVPAAGIVVRNGSGRFRLADGVLQGSELAGDIGKSSFSAGSLALDRPEGIRLRRLGAALRADLADVLAIARRLAERRPLPAIAAIESLDGRAAGAIDYDAERSDSRLTLQLAKLDARARLRDFPLPVTAKSGALEISARRLELKKLVVTAGDTHATVSGTIDDYAGAERRADLHFSQAALGPQGLDWLRAQGRLPASAEPRTPLEIADARLRWPGALAEPVVVQGKLRFAGALDADVDLAWRAGDLDLKRLTLKDADTDASATLRWKEAQSAEFAFDGRFDHRSLARMLAHPPAERGTASGTFRASLDLREPARSKAGGTLQIAGGAEIAGQGVEANARLEGRQDGLRVDGELRAGAIDADKLIDAFTRLRESAGAERAPLWDLPVSGRMAIAADSIAYGGRRLEQVAGSAELAAKRVSIDVAKARLCGIDTSFAAVFTPAEVDTKARLQARGLAVGDGLSCLAGEAVAASGTFDLDADLAARGKRGDLLAATSGKFRFVARGGVIRQEKVIGRVLSDEEVAARLHAGTRKPGAGDFPYREIQIAGTLESGKASLDQGIIDSPDLGMTLRGTVALADGSLDLQGLVSPFGAASGGGVRRGSLVVVPVGVRGTFRDPQVKVLAAQAVGSTLIRLMAAQFLLPLQLINISGADSPRD